MAEKPSETPLFATIGIEGDQTPLMSAANAVRFDIVYELLSLGADHRLKDDNGRDLMDQIAPMKGRFVPGSKQERYLEKIIKWVVSEQ